MIDGVEFATFAVCDFPGLANSSPAILSVILMVLHFPAIFFVRGPSFSGLANSGSSC